MSDKQVFRTNPALDVTSDILTDASNPPTPSEGHPRIAVVEGSGPQLSGEMQCVLKRRLRIASLVLCSGFAVFLVYRLIVRDWSNPVDRTLLIAHAALTVLLGLLGGNMCRRCSKSLSMLRIDELLIFGAPAAFFVLLQSYYVTTCAAEHNMIPAVAGPWFMLMFTYALFIPNNWRRAAVVLGAMAAIPIVLLAVLWSQNAICAAVFAESPGAFIENAMLLTIAAVASTVGTHTIGTLRREAFEAKQLGQYRLKGLLGTGGMGEVHLAEHQLMKRPCAIKLIHPDKAGDPRFLARFEREVRATAKLTHWNTVEIFDYGRADDGSFYYVMEYLPGLSLSEIIERHGPMDPARVIYLLRQVCDALGEAHSAGLIHRDIKPGNIFAAQRGGVHDVAKLLDFGLVKPMAESDDAHISQEGVITGSPLYMAPEQATGESDADERSDIYSLGSVAYHLLSGQPPFAADKPLKVIMAHARRDAVTPPSRIREDIPADLEHVVMKCLEKQPADRFQDVSEMAEALAACELADAWNRQRASDWWSGKPIHAEQQMVAALA